MTTLIKLKYVITVDNNHDIKIGMIANIVLIILWVWCIGQKRENKQMKDEFDWLSTTNIS